MNNSVYPYTQPHIVMSGHLSEGIRIVGPFKNWDDAVNYCELERDGNHKGDWQVLPIKKPKKNWEKML